jgi:hypothetical protein
MRIAPLGKSCPFIGECVLQDFLPEDSSLARIHCYILAQQILLAVHVLNHRLKSKPRLEVNNERQQSRSSTPTPTSKKADSDESTTNDEDSTLQLRHTFAGLVLRCAHETLERVFDDLLVLRVTFSLRLIYSHIPMYIV